MSTTSPTSATVTPATDAGTTAVTADAVGITQRLAVPEDIPDIARLLCSSPDDATLWQWPSTATDWRWMYCRMLAWCAGCFLDDTKMVRVAVDSSSDEIVGVSIWLKRTAMPDGTIAAEPWAAPPNKQAIDGAVAAATTSFKTSHPNAPSSAPSIESHVTAITRSRANLPPSPRHTTPSIHLFAMSVSSSHRRRGIGKALVSWDQHQHQSNGRLLPIYVTGEEGGLKLYRACGFHVIRDTQVWLNAAGEDIAQTTRSADGRGFAWEKEHGGCSMGECVWVPPDRDEAIEIRGISYRPKDS